MSYFGCSRKFASAVVVIFLFPAFPAAVLAQQQTPIPVRSELLKKAAAAPTPRAADGHPDLSGLWNGLPAGPTETTNELFNAGIEIDADRAHDVFSGAVIAMFPSPASLGGVFDLERANSLGRRMGSNKPLYKPEYWARVQSFDANSNEDDPAYHCMAAGVPRIGLPFQIFQTPTMLGFIYPGVGGLLAIQTTFRMIPTDGRQHTPLDDLDGTWNGESIGHWEGDTMVIDTIGFDNSGYIDQVGGYFHSENMHVIERLRRDGNMLTWQATVDDPDVLLKPWTTNRHVAVINPNPKAVLQDSLPCSERDFAHTVTKEHH
jgi:hypothetical protein